jgi:glycosyltransferase involved in cell wall biosynthesis
MNQPMSERGTIAHLQKMTGLAGSEHFLLRLGEGLNQLGWNPHFGLIEEDTNRVDRAHSQLQEAGWTVKRFPYTPGLMPTLVPGIRNWFLELEPQLINTNLIHADVLGSLASVGLPPALVTTKHNDDSFKHMGLYPIFAKILNRAYDYGITISDHLKSFYENELNVLKPQFETIHYGLDPDKFCPNPDNASNRSRSNETINFGIVARLTEQKGHSTLLEAFKSVHDTLPGASLTIVGDGPLELELRELTEQFNLTDVVSFEGYREDVATVLQGFDVFVHPSRWEGFGLVLLEAMASKLPVVATNVSAIPEIVDNEHTGLLVDPEKPDELSRAMVRLGQDKELRENFGQAGYHRVKEKFSVEEMIRKYDELYRRVLNQ